MIYNNPMWKQWIRCVISLDPDSTPAAAADDPYLLYALSDVSWFNCDTYMAREQQNAILVKFNWLYEWVSFSPNHTNLLCHEHSTAAAAS